MNSISTCPVVRPVIKWAGGKSGLLAKYAPHFPPPGSYRRFFEPFIGSAAVFFYLRPTESFLSDSNAELIDVYKRQFKQDAVLRTTFHTRASF